MLLREILEMTKEKPARLIARDHLDIGEKKLREIFKRIGATSHPGKRGWTYQGNSDFLELSIYDLVDNGKKATATKKEQKHEITKSQANKNTGEIINKVTDPQVNKITRKRASFDLDPALMKKIKFLAVEKDQKISQVVEEILSSYFDQK